MFSTRIGFIQRLARYFSLMNMGLPLRTFSYMSEKPYGIELIRFGGI